ncbi:methyl-accepting chemotaxis protein [Ferdinandcohnia quinoae]|uniref:Methyl-accepting chemotaxis protein n=1 Tax=Fredinandcohnia quinoae TaxID=2918902 RepID=A0AAW5DYP1_9BACI|nr:methyl-accepting chemotaxis protein [Fredinandcohnia sp. SECRCQ15]MCH1624125.1 methyl-accepting chemotaxis protein [Fredinandcohnia sp. SECRCQ15]
MKMTISKKLLAGFSGVLLVLIATVLLSYIQIKSVDNTYSNLIDDKVEKLLIIKELDVAVKAEQVGLRGFLILGDETALASFNDAHEKYLKSSKSLGDIITHSEAKDLLTELNQIQEEYYQFSQEAFQLKHEEKTDEYTKLISSTGRSLVKKFDDKILELTEFQQNLLDMGSADTTAKVKSVILIVLALGVAAILIGIIIATYMGRIISKPLIAIANSAVKISSGDLTVDEINIKNKDEIGELANSYNQMSRSLRDIIRQVGSNAEHVAASAEQLTASAGQSNDATKQIAETMQTVAIGVDKQVLSVEETSQAITEMSIGVQQIANSAQAVSETAIEATIRASEGGQSIQTAIEQMNSINQTFNSLSEVIKGLGVRSGEIGQIIEVITGIAGQTNLLALNAAIEAARAGEHGLGFAVVADEVRKLAEQSADSAHEISQLISVIQEETNKSVQLMESASNEVMSGINVVNTAGKSFGQIEYSVSDVTSQIQDVSAAVQQMSAGAEQIVKSVQFISEVSDETASGTQEVSASTEEQLASMEEIATSASALANMAEELQELISRFKL